mmetsp:Transcript_28187/g.71882  ORF Transcript_28187/g.71882 Transcript_28187/m.71882 type:complete len:111 (-) Transcript_28187:464-796(-)
MSVEVNQRRAAKEGVRYFCCNPNLSFLLKISGLFGLSAFPAVFDVTQQEDFLIEAKCVSQRTIYDQKYGVDHAISFLERDSRSRGTLFMTELYLLPCEYPSLQVGAPKFF